MSMIGKDAIFGVIHKQLKVSNIYYGTIVDKNNIHGEDTYLINNSCTIGVNNVKPTNIFVVSEGEECLHDQYIDESGWWSNSHYTDQLVNIIIDKKIDIKELEIYQRKDGVMCWIEDDDELSISDIKEIINDRA